MLNQITSDGIGTLLRELLVEIQAAGIVRVSVHFDVNIGIGDQYAANSSQSFASFWLETRTIEIEEHVGHVYDQTAGAVPPGGSRPFGSGPNLLGPSVPSRT